MRAPDDSPTPWSTPATAVDDPPAPASGPAWRPGAAPDAPAIVSPAALRAGIAAHRFGLGEPSLAPLRDDPLGWLEAQLGSAEPQRGADLPGAAQALREFVAAQRLRRDPARAMALPGEGAVAADPLRARVQDDLRARLGTAALSTQPFNERLALFWANHFTVSVLKGPVRGLAGAFEREAIRPHTGGRFEPMLAAAVTHAAMLRYLDNDNSAGPDSPLVQRLARRPRPDGAPRGPSGLNENLAREVLELHTLGASGGGAAYGGWGGYTQADVTAFAAVLTGWRVPLAALAASGTGDPAAGAAGAGDSPVRFDPAWHQPGPKTVLGRRYPEGPQALPLLLADLARHPSTARHVSWKLARHVVADQPPPALVARLERAWRDTDGHLPSVAQALLQAPEAWDAQPAKLKTPEEFVLSTARLLGLGETAFARQGDGGIATLGQRVQAAPSPAGWPDRAEDWLGPDALWKRVEWATRVADRVGRRTDARLLAQASLGPRLTDATALQIARAADGPQALALLLMAPEFQRR
jgi:uncharacterized protein (DUF1800 family)